MSDELRYGIFKYNRKENTSIIIDKNRSMIYDSRVGFLDLKALSSKDKLESEDKKLKAYMKPLMINATDRNTINPDNYQFYFNKLLTLKGIKIQNDVLTQEKIKANGFRLISTILGIISPGFMIYIYIYPDMTVKNAGLVAMGTSSMLSRASTLVNYGYGEDLQSMLENQGQSPLHHDQGTCFADDLQSSFANTIEKLQEEYIDEEMGTLNRWGQKYLNRLYVNKEEFREEIVNFIRDKTDFDLEVSLDRRYKTNTLNTLGKEYLANCILSEDNTEGLIEILAKFADFDQL